MNIIQLGTKKTMIGLLTQNLPFLATILQPAFVQPPVLTLTFLPILRENTDNFLWPVLKLLFMKTPIYIYFGKYSIVHITKINLKRK